MRERPRVPTTPVACSTPASGGAGGTLVLVAFAAVYAGWASQFKPFTTPVDVCVSVPSAGFAAMFVLQHRWPASGPWRRMDPARPAAGGSAWPWLLVIALLVAVELASYFHSGPRADYPTISSGTDVLFHHRAARAAVWFVWLVVGWFLGRR
jgi:hypothetical protein